MKHPMLCQQAGDSGWKLPDTVERAGLGNQKTQVYILAPHLGLRGCLTALNLIFEMETIKPTGRVIGKISQKNI